MGTSSISKINRLVDTLLKSELEISLDRNLLFLLIYLDKHPEISIENLEKKIKIQKGSLSQCLDILLSENLINKDENGLFYVSQKGKDFLKPIYYSKYALRNLPKNTIKGYTIEEILGEGSTSVTFKAIKEKTRRPVVLKIIKPGILDRIDISQRIKEISPLGDDYLVVPSDYGDFSYQDIQLKFIEMEYVQGKTLNEFFENKIHFEKEPFITHFIQEVGGVLSKIESKGRQHGDLHSNNIMVIEDTIHKGIYHFKVIDFIGVNFKEQFKEYEYSDRDYFRKNFSMIVDHILILSGESEERTLGGKLLQIYNKILKNEYPSFKEIIEDISKEYVPKERKVEIEKPFHIFRFEQYDISDPVWLQVFEPDQETYEKLKSFNPIIISGPRGCGKTIYLKSLSFIPDLIEKIKKEDDLKPLADKYIKYKEIFGIFFPCRQAEFKVLSDRYVKFTPKTELFIKHIFILKIIRKTLALIGRGYVKSILKGTFVYEDIMSFVAKYLSRPFGLMGNGNELSQLSEIIENEETECLNLLGQEEKYPPFGKLLNENKLIEFFDMVNKSVSELQNARFYIIFDDVSDPNMSFEAQRILNSIARTTNSKYCFKISTEKYGYDFSDMEGKILQSPHDFDYIDLATFGKEERDRYGERMKNYLERVVNTQLITARYPKNKKITEYLDELPYSHEELIKLLSELSKKEERYKEAKKLLEKVKYGGWDIICQLSSGSVRVTLQICERIFKECGENKLAQLKTDTQAKIDIDIQHRAITKFSREEYSNLINIKDIGKHLFDIVRNFGGVSRYYLTRDITVEEGRKDERIAIERGDNKELDPKAEEILRILLRYSIFTDTGLCFSRTHIGLVQKFTLHKKFCPALRISFREREHLRLSKEQLELLLLEPNEFAKEGTKFLREEIKNNEKQLELLKNGEEN